MTFVCWWLRRVAGDDLARDIIGDAAESGAGVFRLAAIAAGITRRRVSESIGAAIGRQRILGGSFGDLRYAVRSLRRSPWYATTVTAVIALGMMLATTVFAVVDGVLFKPLPYPEVGRLYAIEAGWRADSAPGVHSVSWSDVSAWHTALPEATFAVFATGDRLSIDDGEPARGAAVSAELFDVLGQPPLLGGFRAADFTPRKTDNGGVKPIVISYEFWQKRFAGDPAILGRVLHGDGGALSEVVGVLSPRFLFPVAFSGRFVPEVLTALPMPPNPDNDRRRGLLVAARIPGGRSFEELNTQVAAAEAALARRFPPPPGARGFGPFDTAHVTPLDSYMRSYQRRTFTLVFVTAIALVFLACLNVTGLAAARIEDRVSELTLRRALGGRGIDLVRLLAAEGAVIVVTGSAIGLLGSRFLLSVVSGFMPPDVVLLKVPALDARVMMFAAIAAALSVGITTVWPVRSVLKRATAAELSAAGRMTRRRGRIGRFVLIGSEVALALVMAVGGALLAGSLARIWREDPGFQTARTFSFWVDGRSEMSFADVDALLADVRRLPGVVSAGGSNAIVLQKVVRGSLFDAPAGASDESDVESMGVTPGFMEIWGLRPSSGRLPTDAELTSGAAVVVVSERVARDYWHGQPAVGHELVGGESVHKGRPYSVIGVVPDARNMALDRDPDGVVYYPLTIVEKPHLASLLVKSDGRAASNVISAVTATIAERHPVFRLRSAATMTAALGASVLMRSFQTMLFASFGVAAVLIVGVGVLGLVAMVTSRRTREVGVRMALGARPSAITRMIVRQELGAVISGLAAGAVVSSWTVGFVRAYLYKVNVYDARIWLAAVAVLLATAGLGAFLPARRASRIDPVKALRIE